MFLAWLYGGHDPWRLFWALRDDYVPLGEPDEEPMMPPRPLRIRNLILGFGWQAQEEAILLAGGKIQRRAGG